MLPGGEIFHEMPECELYAISRFLNVGSLKQKRKKKKATKHTDKTQHDCRLGLTVGPPFCNLWCRGRALHMYLGRPRVSRGSSRGEICHECGESASVQIVDYLKCHPLLPILEKKMLSVCSTLSPAVKQKPGLPASLLGAFFVPRRQRAK